MSKAPFRTMCIATNRGFTLIELLVVIAIIGILASIVLVSLGSARTSGNDAGVKGSLNTVRTQAELYAVENSNSYGVFTGATGAGTAAAINPDPENGPCVSQTSGNLFADPTIKAAMKAAMRAGGTSITCFANGNNWVVAVGLRTTLTRMWCVDSTGNATSTALSGVANAINTAGGRCP